jgi:hypothetical protein
MVSRISHAVTRIRTALTATGQKVGEGRTLNGQERTCRIEGFSEEFNRSQVITTDESTQTCTKKYPVNLNQF